MLNIRKLTLLTLLGHLCSPPVFSGVCVARSLALCVYFVDRYLSFCTFSFGHCVVCSSSIYRLRLLFLKSRRHEQNVVTIIQILNNKCAIYQRKIQHAFSEQLEWGQLIHSYLPLMNHVWHQSAWLSFHNQTRKYWVISSVLGSNYVIINISICSWMIVWTY